MADRKLIVHVIGDASGFEKTLGRASRTANTFSVRLTRSFRGIAQGFGILTGAAGIAGLAAGLRSASDAAAEFESTMQKIVGLSGVAQGEIAGLTQEVLKLAPAVGRGPQELAEGLQFITSSGIAAKDAMDVLEVSAKAAAAGLGETKTVADAITSVMNAYGASVVSAGEATDVLVATVREGKGEADQFAGVIGNVVSIASQLGVSFSDVGAALAAMTRLGTDAETSATQLQQVFSNLVKVSPQQAKAFEAVGLSAAGLRKELRERGLLETLRTIRTAFAGDLPGLSKAFGDIRALRGVLALVGNQAQKTEGIFRRMSQSTGSLDDAFGAISETASQQFARLNAAVDATRITIGAALAPAAEKAAKGIADWLAVSGNQEKVQRAVEKSVRAVGDAAETLVSVFRDLRSVLEPVVDSMGGLKNAAKLLLSVLVASKIVAYTSALTGLGRAAGTSAGGVNVLRASLLRLGAIGVVTIGVEVLLNKDTIDKKVNDFLRGHGLGFFASQKINIPVDADVTDLDKMLQRLKASGVSADLLEEALGKAADQMRRLGTESSKGLAAASKIEQARGEERPTGTGIGDAINKAVALAQNTLERAVENAENAARKQAVAAKKAAAVAKAAAQKQLEAFDALIGSLGLKVDVAAATKGFADDLRANAELQAAIRKQIAVEGKTTELASQLFQAQQARSEILAQQAEAAAQARERAQQRIQAAQFRALGLSSTGGRRIPGVDNLKRQLEQLTERLGADVAPKLADQLSGIGKVLSGALGKVTVETREKIVELFDAIRSEFDKQDKKGPLTKTTSLNANKIIDSLGLSGDLAKRLRSELSGFNSAGLALAGASGGPTGFARVVPQQTTVVHTTVDLDGKTVAKNTTRHQQKRSRRNPPQRRGI